MRRASISRASISRASGFRAVGRLVCMARHEIVVKWGDILVGRYFGEANFRRWRFGKYGPPYNALVISEPMENPN